MSKTSSLDLLAVVLAGSAMFLNATWWQPVASHITDQLVREIPKREAKRRPNPAILFCQ